MSHNYFAVYPHRSIMYKNKLNNNNFPAWYQNLRSVLEKEHRLYVLDLPLPTLPPLDSSRAHWLRHHDDSQKVSYLILSSMSDDFPSDFRSEIEYLPAFDMIQELERKYQAKRNWLFEITKEISKPMKFEYCVGDHVDRLEVFSRGLRSWISFTSGHSCGHNPYVFATPVRRVRERVQ